MRLPLIDFEFLHQLHRGMDYILGFSILPFKYLKISCFQCLLKGNNSLAQCVLQVWICL